MEADVVLALAAAAVVAGAPANLQVNFPRSIGSFVYYVRGTYKGAVRAFGHPSYRKPDSAVSCTVGWSSKGLRIYFRSVDHACRAKRLATAEYSGATILSRRWSVDRGLRVGDSFDRMRKLYPLSEQRDEHHPHRWRVRSALAVQPFTHHRRRAFLDAEFRNLRIYRIDMGYETGGFGR
jgi:hypothetical protein